MVWKLMRLLVHWDMGGMATPIMYRRTESDVPDLIVHYTFGEKDSVIHQVLFDWDVLNFEEKKITPSPWIYIRHSSENTI